MINTKELKEKFLFYHRQKKFQLSAIGWTPNFDWYFIIVFFFVFVVGAGLFTYNMYYRVLDEINSTEDTFVPRKREVDFDEVADLISEYQTKAERLNTLR